MRVTLRQLEVFTAICRHGGVSHAATMVRLSQSAASQSLAELESALDGPLFDRAGRRLLLNERGRSLLPRAVELLERAGALESELRGSDAAAPWSVRLAASLTVGNYLLPPLIAGIIATRPEAHIELDVVNTETVISEVASFRVDAGFIEGPAAHPELDVRPWRDDVLRVVASPDHPLAGKRRINVQDLADARWVLRERGSGTREVFERAAHNAGLKPLAALELGHTEAIKRALVGGDTLACLAQLAVADALQRGELKALPTPFLDLRRTLHLVLHRRKYLGTGLRTVLQACGVSD